MKKLRISVALIAAVLTMSFTIASRTGSLDNLIDPYQPDGECWESFKFTQGGSTIYSGVDVDIIAPPSNPGLISAGNAVLDLALGTDPLLSTLTGVVPQGRLVTLCSENVNIVCCFKISGGTITGVYTGAPIFP